MITIKRSILNQLKEFHGFSEDEVIDGFLQDSLISSKKDVKIIEDEEYKNV